MADWDVIAKQRLTEDWGTLRAAYLPLNQGMRRTIEFLDKGGGTFDELLAVVRERVEGSLHNLSALTNRRSPWVRLEAIRNLRVLATGMRGAASDDPRALLRYLFAMSELLGTCGATRPPRRASPRTSRSKASWTSGSGAIAARSAGSWPPRPTTRRTS
jgi:hypothetical protein